MAQTIMSWHTALKAMCLRPMAASAALPAVPKAGLVLPRNKPGLGAIGVPIAQIPLPAQLVIPLLDYARQAVEPCVAINESVGVGDLLAEGVVATAYGNIRAIEPRPIIHPSYREVDCVVIDVDTHNDQDTQAFSVQDSPTLERLQQACVSGLGGAGYATASKLLATRQSGIETLLVNAVECEPMISCDEALIRSDADAVVCAIVSMIELSQCHRCIVAIEDDKTEAITQLRKSIAKADAGGSCDVAIELVQLPAIYPTGAEKILVQRVTGHNTITGARASEFGVLCLNVATIVAAMQAQAGHPLVSRIVTVGGSRAAQAANVLVRIGTPVSHVLQHTGNLSHSGTLRIRAGGPLSGFDLADPNVPVLATTNCIGIEGPARKAPSLACIRCSHCSDVCPVNLVPQQLHWHAAADDLEGAQRYGLNECIECGCCDIVCPSAIELTASFRHARTASQELSFQAQQARLARERYENRAQRLAAREQKAMQIREQKKAHLGSTDTNIAATLARARRRRKPQ